MNDGKYLPVLVVVAFNRARSLQRLLECLEKAIYPHQPILLVISIDAGGSAEVVQLAEQFQWTHGEKKVILQESHLGLKKHILRCGDLTAEYGSIILLEDDLFVSKSYYDFASRNLNYYDNDARIAGISLYSYDIAENGFNPFVPVDDGSDVYFMQVASSWGQAWTRNQWSAFKAWFEKHPEITKEEQPPAYLLNWQENSWKKHYVRYLHFNEKYFVFPRRSFTTNFEESGGTALTKGLYQVPLTEVQRDYVLAKLDDSKAVYDACFEMSAACLKKWCPFLQEFDFTVDFYGTLPLANCKTPLLLTVKNAKDAVMTFSLEMFPPVLNVIHNLRGGQIKLVKKENVLSEKVAADTNYYKYSPVSEIIFQEELVERVEQVYAQYSKQIDGLHKSYAEQMEVLHDEIRQLHQNYHQQISRLHEDYVVKTKTAVEEALKEYQFKLDYPQFTLVTLTKRENLEAALATAKSVLEQDYPRIRHRVLMVGKSDGLNLQELNVDEKCSFEYFEDLQKALEAAQSHFSHHESDYHCRLEAGSVLLPKALLTVREIFKRFAEVNWVKGLPIKAGGNGEFVPSVNGVNYRWDKYKFYESALGTIASELSAGGIFWKRHLWEKSRGDFNSSYYHIADIEYWKRLFEKDMLYVVFANLVVANTAQSSTPEAQHEFNALKATFPQRSGLQKLTSKLGEPFFNRDIPVLRTLHKSQHAYPPLIRFDYNSQSFYLSEY